MFHMKTSDVVKTSICDSYHNPDGHIRVVLCTTSFSMGLDVNGVDSVVHYGPANTLEDYIQETGRAGRNPTEDCHAILIRYKRSTGSKNISLLMKDYVLSKVCRRRILLTSFLRGTDSLSPTPRHKCCDVCTQDCKCLCLCSNDKCDCETVCGIQQNVVIRYINDTLVSSSESDLSEAGFESGSDFEGYLSKKTNVLQFSDDSD